MTIFGQVQLVAVLLDLTEFFSKSFFFRDSGYFKKTTGYGLHGKTDLGVGRED